jgi:hypothetical protein
LLPLLQFRNHLSDISLAQRREFEENRENSYRRIWRDSLILLWRMGRQLVLLDMHLLEKGSHSTVNVQIYFRRVLILKQLIAAFKMNYSAV